MEGAAVSDRREASSVSRYERLVKIASGGMATVYVGRLRGALGFEQLVAIKRPHAHLMQQPDLRSALLAEARLASRIRHANAVGVRDVETEDDSILLVMDYVEGATFHELLRSARTADARTTIRVGLRVMRDLCAGLQAVHDLTDDEDRPLGAVHRDVSPQNVLVGLDGVARLADFGIAKCLYAHDISTREGTLKGKFSYMAPEYMQGHGFDQRADIFAVGVMLWELLARRRLFEGDGHMEIVRKVLYEPIPPISVLVPELGRAFDPVIYYALARNPAERFMRAGDLGAALESAIVESDMAATHDDVGRFVRAQVGARLAERKQRIKEGLRSSATSAPGPSTLVVERAGPPPPLPSRESSAVSAPDSGVVPSALVSSRFSRHAVWIAIVAVGLVLAVLGVAAAVASRAADKSSAPASAEPRTSASEPPLPASAPSVASPASPPSVIPSPAASTSLGVVPPLTSSSAKAPERIEKSEKTEKIEKPSAPSKPKKSTSSGGPVGSPGTAGSDVPRPRGNPY